MRLFSLHTCELPKVTCGSSDLLNTELSQEGKSVDTKAYAIRLKQPNYSNGVRTIKTVRDDLSGRLINGFTVVGRLSHSVSH